MAQNNSTWKIISAGIAMLALFSGIVFSQLANKVSRDVFAVTVEAMKEDIAEIKADQKEILKVLRNGGEDGEVRYWYDLFMEMYRDINVDRDTTYPIPEGGN